MNKYPTCTDSFIITVTVREKKTCDDTSLGQQKQFNVLDLGFLVNVLVFMGQRVLLTAS